MTTANAVEQDPHYITIPASADLSSYQYRFMTNTSGQAALPSSGGAVIGVQVNDPDAANKPTTIQYSGVALVLAAGSISAGGKVQSDENGKAVAQSGTGIPAGWCMKTTSSGEYCPVLLANQAGVATVTSEETVTTGALSLIPVITYLSVTGTKSYTLAAGTYVGQRKVIECTVAASTPLGTLTLADAYGTESLTHVFTAVGQKLVLEWRTGGWKVIEKKRAGTQIAVIGTTVLTGYDMAALYDAQVTGTVVSATTKGIPDGTVPGERCVVGCSVAASIPVGSIAFTGISTASAALVDLQAIGATTDTVTLEWTGAAWLVVANSGITLA